MPEINTANLSITNHEQGSLELTEELIQVRAYQFYEERGREHGYDVEDWLRAEAEVFGKKDVATGTQPDVTEQNSAAEAA